jgi:hypothetical protein
VEDASWALERVGPKVAGGSVFQWARRVSGLVACCGWKPGRTFETVLPICQFSIAIAIASEDSRLAARAAIKGHLKTDLLRVCKPRSLGSEHLLLSAPRHELGAMQRRLTFQHPWKLGSHERVSG